MWTISPKGATAARRVFAYNEKKGTAQLRGIHFASIPVPFFKDALMSNLHQIEKDIPEIADMWLYLPGGLPASGSKDPSRCRRESPALGRPSRGG